MVPKEERPPRPRMSDAERKAKARERARLSRLKRKMDPAWRERERARLAKYRPSCRRNSSAVPPPPVPAAGSTNLVAPEEPRP